MNQELRTRIKSLFGFTAGWLIVYAFLWLAFFASQPLKLFPRLEDSGMNYAWNIFMFMTVLRMIFSLISTLSIAGPPTKDREKLMEQYRKGHHPPELIDGMFYTVIIYVLAAHAHWWWATWWILLLMADIYRRRKSLKQEPFSDDYDEGPLYVMEKRACGTNYMRHSAGEYLQSSLGIASVYTELDTRTAKLPEGYNWARLPELE